MASRPKPHAAGRFTPADASERVAVEQIRAQRQCEAAHRDADRKFVLEREQWIPQPVDRVFAFFSDAKNLGAITPPWLGFQMMDPESISMRAGAQIVYKLRWHGLPVRWVTEIRRWDPPA